MERSAPDLAAYEIKLQKEEHLNPATIRAINVMLSSEGILFSIKGGEYPKLTIHKNSSCHPGRPHVRPVTDLTLGEIHHKRFMNVPMESIASELGVSRRTLYRKLDTVHGKNIDASTPFSQW